MIGMIVFKILRFHYEGGILCEMNYKIKGYYGSMPITLCIEENDGRVGIYVITSLMKLRGLNQLTLWDACIKCSTNTTVSRIKGDSL